MKNKICIIAEAGVNHNGSVDMAKQLVKVAAECGADIVKFQTALPDGVISKNAPKAAYQLETTDKGESQLEMVKKLMFDKKSYQPILQACRDNNIEFLSTPFDLWGLHFLSDECNVSKIKLPSGEVTNTPLLIESARTQKPIILSTGMCTLGDIERALGILAFGYLHKDNPKNIEECFRTYNTDEGQKVLREKVTLLHCTTEYPAPFEEVNLRCIRTMKKAFDLPVGYSDHTQGISVALAAVAYGAQIIEKHFTLDKNLPGPDHKASLEPSELKQLVEEVRKVEKALGDGVKKPSPAEEVNLPIVRKSLVAWRKIKKGETFTTENLTAKRPATGISPFHYYEMLGKVATRDYEEDDMIQEVI